MAETPNAPNRYERRRLRNRAALLEAAIELFQQQGARSTKLEEICERADVSPRTFFNHFETREHLVQAIARQRAEQMASRIEAQSAARGSFGRKLTRLFGEIASYLSARPAYRELVREMLSLRFESGTDAEHLLGGALLRFVEEGVARREVTARHRPEILADLLFGALTTALGHWCDDEDYDLEAALGQSARVLLDLTSRRRARS